MNDYTTPEGIITFVRDIIGATPNPYQEDVLRLLVEKKHVAVQAPHGAGKTAMCAWAVLWGVSCPPGWSKVLTLSNRDSQTIQYTWPEIRMWAVRANWERMGLQMRVDKELAKTSIRLTKSRAINVRAKDNFGDMLPPLESTTSICVIDEAEGVAEPVWAEARTATYSLFVGTPGLDISPFRFHCEEDDPDGWEVYKVSLNQCMDAGRIHYEWVDQSGKQWGRASEIYKNRVLGEW